MHDCIFCKIVAKQIPAEYLYEDEYFIVFKDIHPKAKVHVLAVPKLHVDSLMALTEQEGEMIGHLMVQLPKIATQLGLSAGFRTVINTGKAGGQEVFHLHVHVLGGG